ncbi:MAG TPA: hypothetical protein VN890_08540, partial [Methylocella sp.]|nr:hypothetical protein [Methylocella sp.]
RAFSSEVETGSRQENASNQESRAWFRFYRNGALVPHALHARENADQGCQQADAGKQRYGNKRAIVGSVE